MRLAAPVAARNMKDKTCCGSEFLWFLPARRRLGAVGSVVLFSLFTFVVLSGSGCIKKTLRVQVPSRILQAKTATFQELINLVNGYAEKIRSLSSTTMRVTFRSGRVESGKLEEYRSAPGYVLLQRPDSIRLSIQNPITKTSILDLASSGDDFSLWVPTRNKFYVGKNSMTEFTVEGNAETPSFTARPIHVFDAILPPALPIAEPGYGIAMEEAQSPSTKYYVLSLYKIEGEGRLIPVRKYWIDRADMALALQETYGNRGELVSKVDYSNLTSTEGVMLPLSVRIERPVDGYSLDLEFRGWHVNPQFPENAFLLTPPPGAELIPLRAKQENISLDSD